MRAAYKQAFLASQESRWLTMQEPMQRNDPGSQINVWKVSILNGSSLKARLPRLCQVGLMTMAGPAPWENLDQEMVGTRMWAVETTSHETELRDFGVRDAGHLHFIDSEPAGVYVLLKCEVAGSHYTFQMPLPLLKKDGVQPTKPFLFLRPADGKHLNSVQHEPVSRVAFSSTAEKMLTADR